MIGGVVMKNRLSVYGTLGPACADRNLIIQMFRAGMTGMRLNLSHRSLSECREWLGELRAASKQLHIVPDLLVDLQGPELRIGRIPSPIPLTEGGRVVLVPVSSWNPNRQISNRSAVDCIPLIPCPDVIFSYIGKDSLLRLDDGKLGLRVTKALDNEGCPDSHEQAAGYEAEVLTTETLLPAKSIAIDGVSIPLPPLTDQDRESLSQLGAYGVTGVMQPFVRTREDLISLRKEMAADHMDHIKVFAKIENKEGVENITDLLPFCDEIIIARGDLGNAIPLSSLPVVQKQIASVCRAAKKPFMVVTQMLASMEKGPVPTRAEVSDVANAIFDGASSIMLTGETAAGRYPVEAMTIFCETAFEAQRYMAQARSTRRRPFPNIPL